MLTYIGVPVEPPPPPPVVLPLLDPPHASIMKQEIKTETPIAAGFFITISFPSLIPNSATDFESLKMDIRLAVPAERNQAYDAD